MQDMIISVVDPFDGPTAQANFVVFKNQVPAVPTQEGAEYFKRCKAYAKEHGAYVVTGLLNIADFLCLCMFTPNGKLCGAQRALFLSPENRAVFQKPDNLALFDTPFGKLFLCVDADIYRPEVQRHARLGGAQIVVCSQYLPEYREYELTVGGWGAAQSNNLLTICANNHVAAICAPYPATPDSTGYLAAPAPAVSTTFNVSHLSDIQTDYHSSHFNHELLEHHRAVL